MSHEQLRILGCSRDDRRPPIVKTRQPNVPANTAFEKNPMPKQIQMNLMVITLLCGVIVTEGLAQKNVTSSSNKMSSQQMIDKLNHMSATEKAAMFDKMTNSNKTEAMKEAGHDMSKMSHQERTEMMRKVTPEQKAEMFDKMPMDTRMATMRIAIKGAKTSE